MLEQQGYVHQFIYVSSSDRRQPKLHVDIIDFPEGVLNVKAYTQKGDKIVPYPVTLKATNDMRSTGRSVTYNRCVSIRGDGLDVTLGIQGRIGISSNLPFSPGEASFMGEKYTMSFSPWSYIAIARNGRRWFQRLAFMQAV